MAKRAQWCLCHHGNSILANTQCFGSVWLFTTLYFFTLKNTHDGEQPPLHINYGTEHERGS
ncbi:Oligoribonuclease, mitochondrial, partial [Clarias magur]